MKISSEATNSVAFAGIIIPSTSDVAAAYEAWRRDQCRIFSKCNFHFYTVQRLCKKIGELESIIIGVYPAQLEIPACSHISSTQSSLLLPRGGQARGIRILSQGDPIFARVLIINCFLCSLFWRQVDHLFLHIILTWDTTRQFQTIVMRYNALWRASRVHPRRTRACHNANPKISRRLLRIVRTIRHSWVAAGGNLYARRSTKKCRWRTKRAREEGNGWHLPQKRQERDGEIRTRRLSGFGQGKPRQNEKRTVARGSLGSTAN